VNSSFIEILDASAQPARSPSSEYQESSFREKLLEHVFLAEILQEMWLHRGQAVEVLHSEVDASGYDLVLECGDVVRHIQLKGSRKGSKTSRQTVDMRLAQKPAGIVVWLVFEEDQSHAAMRLSYRYLGGPPKMPMPDLSALAAARYTRANAKGQKAERPGHRTVPSGRFITVQDIQELATVLFGPPLALDK
jgi:hypothetical protein